MSTQIADLNAAVAAIGTDVSTIGTEITSVQTDVGTVITDLQNAQTNGNLSGAVADAITKLHGAHTTLGTQAGALTAVDTSLKSAASPAPTPAPAA